MRKRILAHAALAGVPICVMAAGMAAAAPAGAANAVTKSGAATSANAKSSSIAAKTVKSAQLSFNQQAATYVKSLEGAPYVYGGTSPQGFDCSGLTQYVYGHLGKTIARTAEEQFQQFRPISKASAWGGDLVFFHNTSNPSSYVYHVGVYEGGNGMVAASSSAGKVISESITWAGDTVTFGTLTH